MAKSGTNDVHGTPEGTCSMIIENFGVKRLSTEIIRRDRAVMPCSESWNPRNLLPAYPIPASNLLALCNYISELAVSYRDTV